MGELGRVQAARSVAQRRGERGRRTEKDEGGEREGLVLPEAGGGSQVGRGEVGEGGLRRRLGEAGERTSREGTSDHISAQENPSTGGPNGLGVCAETLRTRTCGNA